MEMTEKKLALFDAHLSHRGLQHLVDVAAELLGNPLFMADLSMGIVCKSSDMGPGANDYSAEHDPERQLALAKRAADAGYLDWIYHHDKPVIGSFEGQPRYLSARVRDGQQVIGHVVVTEVNRPFEPSDEELLPVICQTLAFELRRTRQADDSSAEYGPLLRDLIDGKPMDEDVARKRMSSMGHTMPPTLRVLVFRLVEPSRTISLAFLRTQLLQCFPRSAGILRDEEEILVVDGALTLPELEKRLRASAYLGGVSVGSSWPFRDLTAVSWAYRQADAALRLSPTAPEGGIAAYDGALVPHVGELAFPNHEDALHTAVIPQLRLLMEFDQRDGTDHVASLAAYLNSGRNVAKAASALHVHKNSVYYRLSRIEELAGIDLSDELTCFLMQFSLALLNMGPKPSI